MKPIEGCVKPGHLASKGDLILVQTKETREALRKAARKQHTLKKLAPAIALDWKKPDK